MLQLEAVKKNIIKAQVQQKAQYDKKHHKPEVFRVGALVLKKDFLRSKRAHGKLDSKWVGPYKIVTSHGRGLYGLELVADPSKRISRVNGVHLKPYKHATNQDDIHNTPSDACLDDGSDNNVHKTTDTHLDHTPSDAHLDDVHNTSDA